MLKPHSKYFFFLCFVPIVMDIRIVRERETNMILNLFRHRDTESEVFILFISTKKDPFIHDKKNINLWKLWEINFTSSNTDVTHHFYVSSLGESIEIKVQKQCGKTLFGNEEILFFYCFSSFFLFFWIDFDTFIGLARSGKVE